MSTPRRDVLLQTALRLFNQYGFHATGIDRVQAESGVSKTTMYKYFNSKDDLILAVLEMRHEQFGAWFTERTTTISQERYANQPFGALFAMFDTLSEWFHSDTFYGCNFINATAEFSEQCHPLHEYAAAHKHDLANQVKQYLPAWAEATREEVAKEILILMDGAIICAHTSGMKDSAERAKRMLGMLLDNADSVETERR